MAAKSGVRKSNPATRKRVVGYLRQSLDREGAGVAIERQRTECQRYADRNDLEVVRWFTDNDTSATSTKPRPAFEAMLEDIRAERPDGILAWHGDRITRRMSDLERLIQLDLPIYTVQSGIHDLRTPAGRAVARTVSAWAVYEGEQKAARQRAQHQQRLTLTGKGWGPNRAFGFQEGNIKHDAREARILRDLYKSFLAGSTMSSLAKSLNERSITTTKGNHWTQASLRAVIANPRNAGLLTYQGQIVDAPAAWKPIVEEKVWRSAVARLTPTVKPKSNARRYLLTGIVRCGVCEGPVRSIVSGPGRRGYECRVNHCTRRSAERLEEFVTLALCMYLSSSDARHLLERPAAGRDESTDEVLAEIDATEQAIAALAESFAQGLISKDVFQSSLAKANDRKTTLARALAPAERSPLLRELAGDDPKRVRKAFEALPLDRQREAVQAVFPNIRILPTKRGARFSPESVSLE